MAIVPDSHDIQEDVIVFLTTSPSPAHSKLSGGPRRIGTTQRVRGSSDKASFFLPIL